MSYNKNTNLITLDKVVIGGEEFLMTSKEITNRKMYDKLIVKSFGSTSNYYDLCTKYFNKYYFDVEKSFVSKLNKNRDYLMETKEGYAELLSTIRKEITKKQTINFFITIVCVGVLLILGIKFWYIMIGILFAVFLAKGFALI